MYVYIIAFLFKYLTEVKQTFIYILKLEGFPLFRAIRERMPTLPLRVSIYVY